MMKEKKSEATARAGMTRRGFIVASLAATAGFVVGGRLSQELFPKVVETPGSVVTTTATKTEQTTKTLTQTVIPPRPPKIQIPEVKIVDKPIYERYIAGPVVRFDQRNTIFSRTLWDPNIPPFDLMYKRQLEHMTRGDAGFMVEDYALGDAAFHLHAKYASSGAGFGAGNEQLYTWYEPLGPIKLQVDDPAEMSEKIKTVARWLGADAVGICEVNQRWIYSHATDSKVAKPGDPGPDKPVNIPYKYAIVMVMGEFWREIKLSPAAAASAASGLGYSKMAFTAPSLAHYIRSLGYPAIPSGNDTAQSVPLAIDAGLGEFGRSGLLITPWYGPRVRICKVFTDLPLVPDKPIEFGVQKFCEETCGDMCARACPAQAIMYGPNRVAEGPTISNRKGILRWPVNVEKCYKYWCENGNDCSNCIAVCPWGV